MGLLRVVPAAVGRRGAILRAVPVGVVLLAACGPVDGAPAPRSTPATPRASSASPAPEASTAIVPGAGTVRDSGAPLVASLGHDGGSLLPVGGGTVHVADQADGSVVLTAVGPAGTLAWVAPPRGGRAEAQADGSVTLRDQVGTVVAALAAPVGTDGARGGWRVEGDVLALDVPTGAVSFVVGTAALEAATWGEAEGGRSLAVVPADWVRGGSLAAQRALASQLAAAEPEAASGSMQAQLWCHVLSARDKASWNLEPWRPEVGTATMLTTRCNPTDDDL